MSAATPLFLTEKDIARVLKPDTIYQVVERTLKSLSEGRVINGSKGSFGIDDKDGQRYMGAITGALLDQKAAGAKWFATCERNPELGLPRVLANIIVVDAATGMLQGVVEATSLTAWRTAALAAVAVNHCKPAKVNKAAIIGFGAIGQALATYLATQFGVKQISVNGRNFEKTKMDCDRLSQSLNIVIRAEPTAQNAVQDADIVLTATGLKKDAPVVNGAWLKPGATVCALGSYQEVDQALITGADRIFVDNWEVCQHRGNLAPSVRANLISRADIAGEIAGVVAGTAPGRTSAGETILIVLIGVGALDIALAAQALDIARPARVGRSLQ